MKTYNGQTIKEIKKEYPNIQLTYCRYRGFGDYGLVANYEGQELFFRDDEPMMDRHVKAEKNNYTGTVANLDYSCEVFVDGSSLGTTSKHRAKKYLSLIKTGVEVDSNYLTSTRPITDFLPDANEEAKNKTAINSFVHSIIEEGGEMGHNRRNEIRRYAYANGLEAAKSLYL